MLTTEDQLRCLGCIRRLLRCPCPERQGAGQRRVRLSRAYRATSRRRRAARASSGWASSAPRRAAPTGLAEREVPRRLS
jgi:hypothetical protein